MTTITLTKTNYFDVIQKINTMLFREKKIMLNLDSVSDIQKKYDEAKKEYKDGDTIYGGTISVND